MFHLTRQSLSLTAASTRMLLHIPTSHPQSWRNRGKACTQARSTGLCPEHLGEIMFTHPWTGWCILSFALFYLESSDGCGISARNVSTVRSRRKQSFQRSRKHLTFLRHSKYHRKVIQSFGLLSVCVFPFNLFFFNLTCSYLSFLTLT